MGPNFDAPHCGFQVNWPILLILSRPLNDVATSVISVMSQMPLFGRDNVFSEADVATTKCCCDLFSLELMSRQLNVVVTFWSLQQMSRPLTDVATYVPCFCCRDCLMMSRPQVFAIDVAIARCCRNLLFSATDVATIE